MRPCVSLCAFVCLCANDGSVSLSVSASALLYPQPLGPGVSLTVRKALVSHLSIRKTD